MVAVVRMRVGNGGWLRVDEWGEPGPLYLRLATDETQERPRLTELYIDGRGNEITSAHLRELRRLPGVLAYVAAADGGDSVGMWDLLRGRVGIAGPDLSRLAAHFASYFGSGRRPVKHWVRDSMRAQMKPDVQARVAPGDVVPQAKMPTERALPPDIEPPAPNPTGGLTPEFLRTVATYYGWAIVHGKRPAPAIAKACGVSIRTVHAWIRKARATGVMPTGQRGRVG